MSFNVCIITAVFPPEPIVTAKTSYSLAVGLVQRNHSVRVITNFPNRPAGSLYKGYKHSIFSTSSNPAGFVLVRCFTFLSKESSMLSRWMENISFGFMSSIILLFSKRPDVVYSNSWPIFATGSISLVCKLRHIPLVISVQDMYPESLVIQDRLKTSHWLYRFLLSFDRWIAQQATDLIVLSDNIAQRYSRSRQIDSTKLHVVANWIDQNSIVLMNKIDYRRETGISAEAFVIIYGGNIGKAAGVDIIIESMVKLIAERETVLIIAGSGSELPVCQKLASTIEDVRILFHSPWNSEETSTVLAAADVLILPTHGTQSLVSVPSKLISYMLAAKPILAMVLPESETAQVIKLAGCGWVIPPDNASQLAEKIKEISSVPSQILEKMGLSGREYSLNHFTAESALPRVIGIIENELRKRAR